MSSIDGIGSPKTLGRLSNAFARTVSNESNADKDPEQQSGGYSGKEDKDLSRFKFSKAEFEAIVKEFENMKFFKDKNFKLKIEGDFPQASVLICDNLDKVLRRLTALQFIAMVKQNTYDDKENSQGSGRLISRKA